MCQTIIRKLLNGAQSKDVQELLGNSDVSLEAGIAQSLKNRGNLWKSLQIRILLFPGFALFNEYKCTYHDKQNKYMQNCVIYIGNIFSLNGEPLHCS